MTDLKATLEAATWVPKVVRDGALRLLATSREPAKALLAGALETGHPEAVSFWQALQSVHLPKDRQARLTTPLQKHLIAVAGARTVRPVKLNATINALLTAPAEGVMAAEAAVLALGQGISLANAHGIYVSATRKAPITALPSTPPHLDGPLPELSIYETVELALGLARVATQKRPSAECDALIASAERVLKLARSDTTSTALAADKVIPAPSKPKGPAFTLARAALKEAWTTPRERTWHLHQGRRRGRPGAGRPGVVAAAGRRAGDALRRTHGVGAEGPRHLEPHRAPRLAGRRQDVSLLAHEARVGPLCAAREAGPVVDQYRRRPLVGHRDDSRCVVRPRDGGGRVSALTETRRRDALLAKQRPVRHRDDSGPCDGGGRVSVLPERDALLRVRERSTLDVVRFRLASRR